MIEEQGRVIECDGDAAWVEANRNSSCHGCSSGGCGTGTLAKLFGQKTTRFYVGNPISAVVGDRVILGIDERVMLVGAMRLYLLPLLAMLSAAILVEVLFAPAADSYIAAAGAAGLVAGLLLNRFFGPRGDGGGHVTILRLGEVATMPIQAIPLVVNDKR